MRTLLSLIALPALKLMPVSIPAIAVAAISLSLGGAIFFEGLKAGLLTFGGAYTVIPFLQQSAVENHHWLTDSQFLDGLAIGGALPAPLIIFSTFVGYLAGGLAGAILMTVGIFLPAFLFPIFFHRQLVAVSETDSSIRAAASGLPFASTCNARSSPSRAALPITSVRAS